MEDYKNIAPPNSYIDVRNFTSPTKLAEHLKFVAANSWAFNFYHQWRDEYALEDGKCQINFFTIFIAQSKELDNSLLSQPSYTAYTQKAKVVLMI